jgi:hypothetical protein
LFGQKVSSRSTTVAPLLSLSVRWVNAEKPLKSFTSPAGRLILRVVLPDLIHCLATIGSRYDVRLERISNGTLPATTCAPTSR